MWLFELDQTTLSGTTPQIPNQTLHPSQITVDSQTESTSCYSTAHGITSGSTPAVAGAVARRVCVDGCNANNPIVGFTHDLGGTYIARQVSGSSRESFAFSVNDASPRISVGRDKDTIGSGLCDHNHIEPGPDCTDNDEPNDGLFWSGTTTTPTVFTELGAAAGNRGDTHARDVHSDGSAVGLSAVPVGSFCIPFAVWWNSSNAVTNVHSVYTTSNNSTRADAIREVGTNDLRVVGADVNSFSGVLWLRTSGTWCADDLNNIAWKPMGTTQASDNRVVLAHDVNAFGHIVGHGVASTDPYDHAFLLTCAADYNGDFLVNGADYGILLAKWGCSGCSEDLTGDGTVDGADLGVIGAAWHDWDPEDPWVPCTIFLPCVCDSSCEEEQSAFGSALSVEEALEVLGFSDGAALAEWAVTASQAQLNNVGTAFAVLIGGA